VVTPWGQFIGAVIMFCVLGFIPGYILASILKAFGLLRVPREVELAGLDYQSQAIVLEEDREIIAVTVEAGRSPAPAE
jgi:ammonia channel protein AmtB